MPSRETILHYVVETVSQITELEPALHLLPWSGVNSAIYEQRFAQCYDEGLCAAQTSAPNVPQGILPSTDWAQGIGLLCFAAGYMSAGERPLTHNQLCDFVKQAAVGLSPIEEEAASGFSTVRSIALPVFRRLQRDGHASRILLLQTLLHLVAWKSASQYARQQAQRLLWMGGILGEGGSIACLHWIRRYVKKPSGRKVSPLC
ncbi:Membrane protein associated with oxaloacetate decarboxylase [Salmonella enterica subsp. enterica serovar Mississippi str. A4-633]|nr:Membrane protein associated with oxaloacetate decarboxylase [Salmonella enterica subsp. enterica serovar Mississippi str. A4-633]